MSASSYECAICLDSPSDPVVTRCGHLYCWPCLFKWLERSNSCPICKGAVSRDTVIPLYANNRNETERPHPAQEAKAEAESSSEGSQETRQRNVPERPRAQREEAPQQGPPPQHFHHAQFHFGFGPFMLGPQLHFRTAARQNLSLQEQRQMRAGNAMILTGMLLLMLLLSVPDLFLLRTWFGWLG
ncbi:MAG: hypothetical protein MHM6MM_006496 [Cercozoa sp. M6MM]